jgi:hypothetical protein
VVKVDIKTEDLMPVLADVVRCYVGCDNTSISYERAEELLNGIMFCIDEFRNSASDSVAVKDMPVSEQYNVGTKLVAEKAGAAMQIYNHLCADFDDYGVECLRDTVMKGIPEFFRRYNSEFFPHDTILTLDYPVLGDVRSLCGIDAIYAFLSAVECEQRFLGCINREYITCFMKAADPEYELMIDNICGAVLPGIAAHFALGKSLDMPGFTAEEYSVLTDAFSFETAFGVEQKLKSMLKIIEKSFPYVDKAVWNYLSGNLRDTSVRIHTAIKLNVPESVFVI